MVVVSHVDVGRWIGDGDAEGGCRVSDVKPSCAAPCLPQSLAVRILKAVLFPAKHDGNSLRVIEGSVGVGVEVHCSGCVIEGRTSVVIS